MNKEEVEHKRNLISIYTKNLQALEVRQADSSFDLGLINQIENIKTMIAQLEDDIGRHTTQSPSSSALRPVPFPLQKYESFVTRFAEELGAWNGEMHRYERSILISLKRAAVAKHVFIAKYIDGDWRITAEHEDATTEVTNLLKQPNPLREVLSESAKLSNLTVTTLLDGSPPSLMLSISYGSDPGVLVIYETRADIDYDNAVELILRTMVERTSSFRIPLPSSKLEVAIYNQLKETFGYVSDSMYNRQFYLFNSELESMSVHFEPILFLNPTSPSIFGWEALARDESTQSAPVSLFETAELWGPRFQLQLDMYFLERAVNIYVQDSSDPSGNRIRRKHTLLPLSVNVNPASLLRTRYFETIKKLDEQGHMALNKLYLEISEKAPVPTVENWDGNQNITEAFREFLYRYRDLDVHFSVDDFGVGFASSSRVSRLGPAFVKIDRDALLDSFGNFTLEYVIRLSKRMPGEMRVIVEGYDDESRFSLKRLYELGVRYIQGHKYGPTRPQVDDRLPGGVVQEIRNALQGLS